VRPQDLLLLTAVAASVQACGNTTEQPLDEPVVVFDREQTCLASATDTVAISVEIAATRAQQAHGLMERDRMPSYAGMLFTYDTIQPPDHGFWMFRTRVPLDIAFIGPEGEIRSIQTMIPCESPNPDWCPTYPAGVEFSAALEMNQGFFRDNGIQVGDRVLRSSTGECGRA
jgi:uncharacterized membrane protein (UPF0127 family)